MDVGSGRGAVGVGCVGVGVGAGVGRFGLGFDAVIIRIVIVVVDRAGAVEGTRLAGEVIACGGGQPCRGRCRLRVQQQLRSIQVGQLR